MPATFVLAAVITLALIATAVGMVRAENRTQRSYRASPDPTTDPGPRDAPVQWPGTIPAASAGPPLALPVRSGDRGRG